MKTTKEIVNNFLAYLTERDLKNIINLFAENVNWEVPWNDKNIK